MGIARRMARRAKKVERRFSMTDAGRAFLAWMIASGMPIPAVDAPAVLELAVIVAVAIANGEVIDVKPEAPGYPLVAWITAHKDEVAAVWQAYQRALA